MWKRIELGVKTVGGSGLISGTAELKFLKIFRFAIIGGNVF